MELRADLDIRCPDDVYPPSEDSELLIRSLDVRPGERVLEIGCGSGVVAIHCALAGAEAEAVDVNPSAVRCTQENAEAAGARVRAHLSDLFSSVDGTFDTVAFNLPYLPVSDEGMLARAWSGGPDGLGPLPALLAGAPAHLREGGRVVVVVSSLMDAAALDAALEGLEARELGSLPLFFERLRVLEVRGFGRGRGGPLTPRSPNRHGLLYRPARSYIGDAMAESRNRAERAEPASDGGCRPVPVHSLPCDGPAAEAVLMDGMLWMTADSISALLGIDASAMSQHLSDIFSEGELDEGSAVSFPDGAGAGGRGLGTRFYSLDAVISVGWRADSERAADFRAWATRILKELVVKGFALDDERLERGFSEGDRSRDLLERMRSIRASDRRIWQKITDVFAECSANYDRDSPTARRFYGTVGSRFRNAIAGTAAAEDGAEGCLTEEQIRRLEREAPGFFDYIEGLFERGTEFTMDMFADSACRFLESGDYRTLDGGWGAPGPGPRVKAGPGCGTLDGGEGCASELCMRVGELAGRRSAHVRPAAPP